MKNANYILEHLRKDRLLKEAQSPFRDLEDLHGFYSSVLTEFDDRFSPSLESGSYNIDVTGGEWEQGEQDIWVHGSPHGHDTRGMSSEFRTVYATITINLLDVFYDAWVHWTTQQRSITDDAFWLNLLKENNDWLTESDMNKMRYLHSLSRAEFTSMLNDLVSKGFVVEYNKNYEEWGETLIEALNNDPKWDRDIDENYFDFELTDRSRCIVTSEIEDEQKRDY